MKKNTFRRSFVGASLAATSTAAVADVKFIDFSRSKSGRSKIAEVLASSFSVDSSDSKLIDDFYTYLLQLGSNARYDGFMSQLFSQTEIDEQLEIFVVEEFVVATNYFATLDDSKMRLEFTGVPA